MWRQGRYPLSVFCLGRPTVPISGVLLLHRFARCFGSAPTNDSIPFVANDLSPERPPESRTVESLNKMGVLCVARAAYSYECEAFAAVLAIQDEEMRRKYRPMQPTNKCGVFWLLGGFQPSIEPWGNETREVSKDNI